MKRLTLTIALLAAFAAHAQDSNSNAGSNASSSSNPVVSNGTSNSTSNVNANAASQSGTSSNMQGVSVNYYAPGSGMNPDGTPQQQATNADGTPRDGRDRNGYAVQRSIVEGGTTNRNIQEGDSTQRVVYSGTQTVKNVPSIQMSGPASGPCTGVSGGIGISGPGWGVGLNGSAVMDDCRLRENTRVLGMAMQSIDGNANPQERGEVTVIFMDAVRALGAYNKTIYDRAAKEAK